MNPPKDKKSSNLKFSLGDKFDGDRYSSGTSLPRGRILLVDEFSLGMNFPGTNFPRGQIFWGRIFLGGD
jgi:hypothetical protein